MNISTMHQENNDMRSPNTSNVAESEDNFDLLDLALTIAENIWLLVLGPLLAGGLVYGLTFLLPHRFESNAILEAEASMAAHMTTASVLDTSLRKLGYLSDLTEDEADDVREKLIENIRVHNGRNDKLVTLTIAGSSPEAAQKMANEILVNAFAASKPRGDELRQLETEKNLLERQVKELTTTSQTVQSLLSEASPTGNQGSLAESIPAISSSLTKMQEGLHSVEKKLSGLTADDLIQAPTLPKRSVAPKKGVIAILATIGTGFALLMFVFLRQSWRNPTTLALHQGRLVALKRKYGFNR